jgi:hypothetical protein
MERCHKPAGNGTYRHLDAAGRGASDTGVSGNGCTAACIALGAINPNAKLPRTSSEPGAGQPVPQVGRMEPMRRRHLTRHTDPRSKRSTTVRRAACRSGKYSF